MNKKVAIVAPVHCYNDVRVFQKEATTLASNGYEVILLARSDRLLQENKVTIKPVPKASNRLLRFLKLPLVLKMALAEDADIYHLHNPDTLPIAIVLKLFNKCVIYDTHEDFSQRILLRDWIPKIIRPAIAGLVANLESMVARIVDLSIATQLGVQARLGKKALLIENFPIITGNSIEKAHSFALTLPKQREFLRLIYIGSISESRGLSVMLEALAIANQEVSCRLWLIGSGIDKELTEAKNHPAWKFVDYNSLLPQWQAFGYVINSDVGLITILDVGDHAKTSPNKLYEYQVFGIPFIASNFVHWQNYLEGFKAGWFVDPTQPEKIASKIVWFARNRDARLKMGEQGKKFIATCNWELESIKLIEAYEFLC